jgi:hypothetical protein
MKARQSKRPRMSGWVHWPNRSVINHPGVYVLAHLRMVPKGPADHTIQDVIYIGESSKPLRSRWLAFHRSASSGKRSHSGGRNYNEQFKKLNRSLHVAWLEIEELNESLRNAKIRYWERRLLLEFAERRNREKSNQTATLLPCCNRH